MKKSTIEIIEVFNTKYPNLTKLFLVEAVELVVSCYRGGNKLLVCGNGGSAADALHIVGELMKGFVLERRVDSTFSDLLRKTYPNDAEYLIENLQGALPAISLVSEIALNTAYANDKASDLAFAQQILGHGKIGDILIAISTSGNSNNVLYAAKIAKIKGLKVISMTGETGGKLKEISDILINVPSRVTHEIQELHLPVYHTICLAVENEMFSETEV